MLYEFYDKMKYAVVSGASSGIGYALSEELGKKGYTVLGVCPEKTHWATVPLQKQYGLIPLACDLTKLEDILRVTGEITKLVGSNGIEILFNNAGIHVGGPGIEMEDSEIAKIFQVNVTGHIYMTKHLIDNVILAKGAIVYTSSIAAIFPVAWSSLYGATKLAIDMYAKVLRQELKPFGVRVYLIIAGLVDTPVLDASQCTQLAAGSRYDVDGILKSRLLTNRVLRDGKYPAPLFAKQIVALVISKSNLFNLYRGRGARVVLFMARWFPLWFQELANKWVFAQLKVFRNVKKQLQLAKRLKLNNKD